jgi:lysophospholipase L1-like esterase
MQFSRRTVVLAFCAVVAALYWWTASALPRAAKPTSGRTIVAFGDSLVEGRGATPGRDFVSVLARRLGTRIVNAGQSGDTTAAALARLDSDVLSRDPKVVIVLLGGNDYLRRVPPEQTFANLEKIVDRIRRRGAAVILVGVSVGLLSDPYASEYTAVARRNAAGLVPDILDGIMGNNDLMADSIHPNDRGYAIIAERLESAVRQTIQ